MFLNVVLTNFMRQIIFYYIYVYLTPYEESNMLYVDPNWLHTDFEYILLILPKRSTVTFHTFAEQV